MSTYNLLLRDTKGNAVERQIRASNYGQATAEALQDAIEVTFSSRLDAMEPGWHRDAVAMSLGRVNWGELADSLKGE